MQVGEGAKNLTSVPADRDRGLLEARTNYILKASNGWLHDQHIEPVRGSELIIASHHERLPLADQVSFLIVVPCPEVTMQARRVDDLQRDRYPRGIHPCPDGGLPAFT